MTKKKQSGNQRDKRGGAYDPVTEAGKPRSAEHSA
jgi:hypothetical protein